MILWTKYWNRTKLNQINSVQFYGPVCFDLLRIILSSIFYKKKDIIVIYYYYKNNLEFLNPQTIKKNNKIQQ